MKYLIDIRIIGIRKKDMEMAPKWYHESLRIKKETIVVYTAPKPNTHIVKFVNMDDIVKYMEEKANAHLRFERSWIEPYDFQTKKLKLLCW